MTASGARDAKGEVLITVDGSPLDWRSSLAVREPLADGSVVGLQRGVGSGPARALSILLAVAEEATAERFYQKFQAGGPGSDRVGPLGTRHLPAASPERWETVAGECLGCLTQFAIDVRLPLPARCPDCGADVLASADIKGEAQRQLPFDALRIRRTESWPAFQWTADWVT